jgi:hypothetical protein
VVASGGTGKLSYTWAGVLCTYVCVYVCMYVFIYLFIYFDFV